MPVTSKSLLHWKNNLLLSGLAPELFFKNNYGFSENNRRKPLAVF
jgi:hypothetical protein